MKLVTYNIQYGRGRDDQYDLDRIADAVRGADVIALQEVARHWERNGFADQAAELAEKLGEDYHWAYGAGVDLDAPGAGPNARRQFGNMLLSKSRILSVRNHLLPKTSSIGPVISLQRAALECLIRSPQGRLLRVYSLHLSHLASATRIPQVERLIQLHRDAVFEGAALTGAPPESAWVSEGMPDPMPREAILLGDFNMEPSYPEYALLVGPRCDYGGRVGNPELFVDAWVAAGHGEDDGVTSDILGRPARLDYALLSPALASLVRSVEVDGKAPGSDHQPVWLDLDA